VKLKSKKILSWFILLTFFTSILTLNTNNTIEASTAAQVIFEDDFANATSSNILTAGYKSLSSDSSKAMYVKTGGTITAATGALTIKDGRITIGALGSASTSATVTPGGAFDLSKEYRISIKFINFTGTTDTSKKFQIYVDNNSTSSGSSIHGADSKIYESTIANLSAGTITIDSTVGTAASFLQIRTETGATVTIGEIKIERVGNVEEPQPITITSVTTPSAITVTQGEVAQLPEKVTAKYSDNSEKEVAVTWEAVDTAAVGTKVVKGAIEGFAAGTSIEINVIEKNAPVPTIISIKEQTKVTVEKGKTPLLPATVRAVYSDESEKDVAVNWGAVSTADVGTVTVQGTVEGFTAGVTIQVEVIEVPSSGAKVAIINSKGWLESASMEWNSYEGAAGYNVYYKAASTSDSEYKKIDGQLVRKYPLYFRADALGLAAGNYVLKVVPIVNGKEDTSAQAVTEVLEVKAHVREGFAFSSLSPAKTASGGYNDNGTVPSDAQILYVTASNVNTITLSVVTSSNGAVTNAVGLANILLAREKGYDKTPLIIRMIGEINAANITGLNSNGYLQLKGCYNITFEGVGKDATINGWGILIRNAQNVEVRNFGIMLFPDDGISLDTDNRNIWVHNNDIFYGTAGGDADQAKGDGSLDTKKSTYVTLSYNHFWDSGKSSLCGMGETAEYFVTYHHNWFDHSDSRHPRIRVGTIHVYNNYYDGVSKYGVGATTGSSAFVEANYFRNTKYPMLISLQGTDISTGTANAIFSGENGGIIKAYNNVINGTSQPVYYHQDNVQFDAYLAETRNEQVPNTVKTLKGGHVYNNFDTASTMYSYAPHSPEEARENVMTYAGRVEGGDFRWSFTAADETDYSINQALMSAIRNYTSGLVAAPKTIASVTAPAAVTVEQGKTAQLPSVVNVVYTDGASGQVNVTWASVDTSTLGTKTVQGTIAGFAAGVSVEVKVIEAGTVVTPPGDGAALPYVENFATADSSNFFTAAYRALPGTTTAMYVKTGGTVTASTGNLVVEGGRFTIGALGSTGTTTSTTPGGVFDLSSPYRITIVTGAISGDTAKKFQVYVDNNTTSSGSSIHGSASKVFEDTVGNSLNKTITIEATVGTASSFLQIRTESASSVTIKSITIEYLGAQAAIRSIKPVSAITVGQGKAASLPTTVTAVYDNGSERSVAVTWQTVDTSTTGTKTVHGTIAGFEAGVDIQVIVIEPVPVEDETPAIISLIADETYVKGENYILAVLSNENGTVTIEVNDTIVVADAALQAEGTGYKYTYSVTTADKDSLTIYVTVKDQSGNTATIYKYAAAKVTETEKDFTINSNFNLSSLQPNKMLEVQTVVTNNKSSIESVLVIIALFDGNDKMINMSYISKDIPKGYTENLNAGFKLPSDVTSHRVKVFVWEGTSLNTSSMQPLSNVVELYVNK
jgi:pectate lyase